MTTSLVDRLRQADPAQREKAMYEALALDGTAGSEALSVAIAAQLDGANSQGMRELAAMLLVKQERPYMSLLPRLTEACEDASALVRERIARVLLTFPADSQFRAILLPLLQGPESRVRIGAARAVWKHTQDTSLVEGIVRAELGSLEVDCIVAACHLITEMESVPDETVEAIRTLLTHEDGSVRGNALFTLHRLGEDREWLLGQASLLAEDIDPHVRYMITKITRELSVR